MTLRRQIRSLQNAQNKASLLKVAVKNSNMSCEVKWHDPKLPTGKQPENLTTDLRSLSSEPKEEGTRTTLQGTPRSSRNSNTSAG